MSAYVTEALRLLKTRGYRITVPRRRILDLLDTTEAALNPYEIKAHLEAVGEPADISSIYRVLECLETNGLVHRILANGKFHKCHLDQETNCHRDQLDHCHHNLVCRGCGAVEEVHCPGLSAIARDLSEHSRFRIEAHQLEFQGLCARCA